MKKALLIIIAIVIVAVAIVVGTRFAGPRGPQVKDPFTFDYKLDAKNVEFFTKGDDMATLLACTPFYAGAQPLPGQHTQEFDEARARKVDEIIADSDRLAESAIGLKSDVGELRKALMNYLTVCANNDPKAKTFADDAGREALRLWTLEALTEAEYKSIDTKSDNPFARSYMQYMKTSKAVELGALYLQDIDSLVGFAAMGLDGLSGTKNAKIIEANKQLDDAMGKFDGMKGRIGDVMSGMHKVDYGFKQLRTGDYYYARAAVKFMRDSMPALKKSAQSIKPSQYMNAQTVAFTKGYLAKFDNFSAGFQAYLDSVPKTQLLPVASLPNSTGCAFAQDKDKPNDYGTAYLAMAAPSKDPAEPEKGWLATGWNGVKTVVHGTQSVIGVGLDVAGTAVKNITRVGAGVYYGNSAKEIWKDMKDNSNQIFKNWASNKSGAEIMHNANGYINAIDDGAEYIASKAVENPYDNGWISWGVGKVAKATAGIFTGLGKGITLLGNRDSQASDYVIGTMEIAGSMIGGSKLIMKGTMLPGFLKGLGKGAWIGTKGGYNAASTLLENAEKSQIEALVNAALKDGIKTTAYVERQAINEAMMAAISQSNQALKTELGDLIKTGLKEGWANFNGTLRQSLFDFSKKQFTANLKGVAELLGGSKAEFIDNIMAQWGEDYIKEMVDQAMAQAPLPAELKGGWTGTTVFSSIQVPEAASEKAAKDGCDIFGAFKKLQGKPLGTNMHLDGSPSGSGNAVVHISFGGKGSPISARYTYSAGTMTINQGIKGGTVSMKGDAKRMTQGYAMGGPITLTAGANGVFITMSGEFDVTKPH
jgi:hypothetical protein